MVWLLLCTEAMPSRDRSNELIALAARRPVKAAGTIELVVGDLAGESIEAIVSPVGDGATSVSRAQLAIQGAGGPGLVAEYDALMASLPSGVLAPLAHVVTSGHALACRYVLHCRPLHAAMARDQEKHVLGRCLRSVFDTCRALGVRSVALPAIGTGTHGYDVSTVARVAVSAAVAAQQQLDGPELIRFLLAGPATLETFLHALSDARDGLVN